MSSLNVRDGLFGPGRSRVLIAGSGVAGLGGRCHAFFRRAWARRLGWVRLERNVPNPAGLRPAHGRQRGYPLLMGSDLAVTVAVGSVALLLVAMLFWWVGRATSGETVRWARRLGIWTPSTRESEDAWRLGHRAAAPFLGRYARLLLILAAMAFLFSFFSDIAAVVAYLLGLLLLVLGVVVVRRKAHIAANAGRGNPVS